MMNREAFEYLAENLGHARQMEIDGRTYTDRKVFLVRDPQPDTIMVSDLTSLIQYLLHGPDDLPEKVLVHVISPVKVAVCSPLSPDLMQRDTFLRADAKLVLPEIILGDPMTPEGFQIMLRTAFMATEERKKLLKLVGNVVEEAAVTVTDDGVSQETTVRSGVATRAKVRLPNPVQLQPYRTFLEVDQPESSFIFRMHKGPYFSLHEADGGAWRRAAMHNISTWLSEKLEDHDRFVIIG